MKPEQLKPFVKVRYFQPNYPERNGNIINRLAVTYYYLGHINSISNERDLTENEKKDGFTVEFYSINQKNAITEITVTNYTEKVA